MTNKTNVYTITSIYWLKIDDAFTNNKQLSFEETATSIYIGNYFLIFKVNLKMTHLSKYMVTKSDISKRKKMALKNCK